jgi:hypothetical protein
MLLGDKRAYHEYLSDVKAAILARNLPRPSSEQPRSPTSAGNELPDQHRVPPSPAAPAVAMPPALREKSAIKSMDDFTDTDDLMKPIELSPHKQPPTPLHHLAVSSHHTHLRQTNANERGVRTTASRLRNVPHWPCQTPLWRQVTTVLLSHRVGPISVCLVPRQPPNNDLFHQNSAATERRS